MYYIRFENDIQVEVSKGLEYTQKNNVGDWVEAPENFNPSTQIASLVNSEIVLADKPTKTRQETLNEVNGRKLVYNGKFQVGNENFRSNFLFSLTSKVTNNDIDSRGDIVRVKWYKGEQLAIEENRVYTRTETGIMPNEVQVIKKDTTIKFYRNDGGHILKELQTRVYNNKERKEKDQKSRANVLEKTRELTGLFIANMLIGQGRSQDIQTALGEALNIFHNLNTEINEYKFERLSSPLVQGVTNYPQTANITQDVIDYIVSLINIQYYDTIIE